MRTDFLEIAAACEPLCTFLRFRDLANHAKIVTNAAKNNRDANLRNGELRKVAAIEEDRITLDNGRQLNSSRPLYTDSREVLLEAALRPGQGMSAVELIDGEPEPEVNLWQIGLSGDTTQKEAELVREVQRSRQMTKESKFGRWSKRPQTEKWEWRGALKSNNERRPSIPTRRIHAANKALRTLKDKRESRALRYEL